MTTGSAGDIILVMGGNLVTGGMDMTIFELFSQIKQVSEVKSMLIDLYDQLQGRISEENIRLLRKAIDSTNEVWMILRSDYVEQFFAEKEKEIQQKEGK